MTCPETQGSLVDLLYEELDAERRAAVVEHLGGCRGCRERWDDLRALSAVADRWAAPPPPRGIAERALARVTAERAREVETSWGEWPVVALQHLLGFLLAGAVAASASLLLVAGGAHEGETPLKLGLVGAAWAALYGAAGCLTQHPRYRRLALAALVATGLSVVLAPVLSVPALVEVCRRWLEAAQASPLLNAALVLAGLLHTAAPVFVSSASVGRARAGEVAGDSLRLAGVYGVLLAPSVYLQCQALTLGLTAPWVAGVVLGSWLGSIGGVSVAARRRRRAAA